MKNPKQFDLLADLCESNQQVNELVGSMMKDVKLFCLDKTVGELPFNSERYKQVNKQFFLPFERIAVEDPESVVILQHIRGEGLADFEVRWCSFFATQMLSPQDPIFAAQEFWEMRDKFGDICSFQFGTYIANGIHPEGDKFYFAGKNKTEASCMFSRTMKLLHASKTDSAVFAGAVRTALEEVIYFNDPEHFVMETTTATRGTSPPHHRIPRTNRRPLYTMIKPKRARDLMNLTHPGAGTGTHKSPHERRAHYRTLASDYYKEKKGQTIVIPSTWIGPKEAIIGDKTYRILTNL